MTACTLLVLNHNGSALLQRYLPSVLEAARPGGHPVVVVDNRSTDDSREVARRLGAEVLPLEANDFLVGLNEGVRRARTPVVLTLNNDVKVRPDFLGYLLEHFRDPGVFAVGCKVLYEDGRGVQMARVTGRFYHGLLDPVQMVGPLQEPDEAGPQPTLYAGAGACAYHRERFLELGGFDRLYLPLYWEDVDLCYAAWRRGWRSLYDPRAVIVHADAATTGALTSRRWREQVMLRNQFLLAWKNFDDPGLIFASLRTWFWQVRRAAREPGERWRLRPLFQALRRLPYARMRRRRMPAAAIPDREVCPLFVPGKVRWGLGRGACHPGDVWGRQLAAPVG